MSSTPIASARRTPRRTAVQRRTEQRRRRAGLIVGGALLAALAVLAVGPVFRHAVEEIRLPLRHEDIIRQQAREKNLDPALVAGVIYVESKFVPRTSSAGAEGLMQILPSTAEFLAKRSGGTSFHVADLATPQVNIAYGTYYLSYLIRRYGGNETLAVAAYNGGEANVDAWLVKAAKSGRNFGPEDIPFPETRAYVARVFAARDRYKKTYSKELGL